MLEEVTKRFNERTEEIKRHFDVSVEEFKSQFKVYGEQLTSIEEKVEKIDLLVDDMDYVKSEIVEIKDRFKETDEALAKKAEKEAVSSQETRLVKLENTALAKV